MSWLVVIAAITGLAAAVTIHSQGTRYQPRYIRGTEFEHGISAHRFGLSETGLQALEARVWKAVVQPDYDYKATTPSDLGATLRSIADHVSSGESLNADGRAYVFVYTVAAWVKSHMTYFTESHGDSNTGRTAAGQIVSFEKRGSWIDLNKFLSCASLVGACRHSAVLSRELISSAGADLKIKAHYLGGWARGLSAPLALDSPPTHAWNLVILPSGLRLVFDGTGTSRSIQEWRNRIASFCPSPEPVMVIPRSPEELESFFSIRYGTMLDGWFEPAQADGVSRRSAERLRRDTKRCLFMKFTLTEWLSMDNRDTKPIHDYVYQEAARRARARSN